MVTSAETTIGSERNLLKPKPMSCNLLELKSPILTNEEFAKLKHINHAGFKSQTLPILFKAAGGEAALVKAMDDLCACASSAVESGASILILSDRGVDHELAPIPALLAVAGVHHHLIRDGTRTRVGLVLESGEPREVHHFSLLIGYGAGAINPYVAFETLDDMIRQGLLTKLSSTRTRARISSRRRSKAWSRSLPRWEFRPFRVIGARRFSRPSDCTRR